MLGFSSIKIRNAALALTLVMAFALLPDIASASTVTVNGIKEAGEYTGNSLTSSSGSESLQWYNDHHSQYGPEKNKMNTMYWEINEIDTDDYSLNLFVEVPLYARRMIWVGKDKDDAGALNYGGDASECDPDCNGIPKAVLDAYFAGATFEGHKSSVKMDYGTQTGSEYFRLNGTGGKVAGFGDDLCFGLQDDGGHCGKGGASPQTDPDENDDSIYWQTSRHWVLANGCTTALCAALNTSMSLEVELRSLTLTEAEAMRDGVSSLRLHLSDEAYGIPQVPVPAAFWLFGTAIFGLIGMRRKAKLAA
jgi:hypothetical protein